jgi:hypothetical protein
MNARNARPLKTIALAAGMASVLSGCAITTYLFSGPNEAMFGEDAQLFGYVTDMGPYHPNFKTGDCSPGIVETLPARFTEICRAPAGSFILVAAQTHVKQGVPVGVNVLVPKSTPVKVADIIEVRYIPKKQDISFVRIASSPDSPNRASCDWQGGDRNPTYFSRNPHGPRGVVCEGYNFRNLPHFRRSW